MPCVSSAPSQGAYQLPEFEQALYRSLAITSVLLALLNFGVYMLLTHFRYQPQFAYSPHRQGRRGWLLLILSLSFVGQACNDVYHAHLTPCLSSVRLWPDYLAIRLAFQAPVGGLGALVQLERASSICLKSTRLREGLWVAGCLLFGIITPMNVVFTVLDAERHKHVAGYWPQYQGLDWLYSLNLVFPIVGVAATLWTIRVAFSPTRVRGLKVASGSASSPSSRTSSESGSLAERGVSQGESPRVSHSSPSTGPAGNKPQGPAPLSSKCASLRLLHALPQTLPDPVPPTSPIQLSIQRTFKMLSVMSIVSWAVGSAMVLGASSLSPAPRFCMAAMAGFPGLTVEILFKRLVRLRKSRRRAGSGARERKVLSQRQDGKCLASGTPVGSKLGIADGQGGSFQVVSELDGHVDVMQEPPPPGAGDKGHVHR